MNHENCGGPGFQKSWVLEEFVKLCRIQWIIRYTKSYTSGSSTCSIQHMHGLILSHKFRRFTSLLSTLCWTALTFQLKPQPIWRSLPRCQSLVSAQKKTFFATIHQNPSRAKSKAFLCSNASVLYNSRQLQLFTSTFTYRIHRYPALCLIMHAQ